MFNHDATYISLLQQLVKTFMVEITISSAPCFPFQALSALMMSKRFLRSMHAFWHCWLFLSSRPQLFGRCLLPGCRGNTPACLPALKVRVWVYLACHRSKRKGGTNRKRSSRDKSDGPPGE